MSNTEEPPLFRILCLHDENSSALALSKQLKRLDRQLRNHAVELCFLNSPLLHSSNDNNGGFVWWENNDDTVEPQYVGLDATLLHVKQVLACTPFVAGILAVGKGAALLPFLINDDLEFAILVHGKSILEEQERLVDEDWPVLHIVGASVLPEVAQREACSPMLVCTLFLSIDPDFDSSQHFIDQFGGQVHECTSRFDVSALNAIGKVRHLTCRIVHNRLSTRNPHLSITLLYISLWYSKRSS